MPKSIESSPPEPSSVAVHLERAEVSLTDEDPHRAALEDNPEHAELSWSAACAVLVS